MVWQVVVVLGEEQIKKTHFICPHCETGSELGPYLKDLHLADTQTLSCETTHMFMFCSHLPSAEGTLAMLGSVYQLKLLRKEGSGR